MKSEIVPPHPRIRETFERPKARFFGFVSLMWCCVSFIPVVWWVLDGDVTTYSDLNRAFWLLVVPHPVFIGLAIYFRLTERPRRVSKIAEEDSSIIH